MLRAIEEWDAAGLIHRYAGVDGRAYGHVVTFLHHQRARDSRSRYPEPPCGNLPQNAAACGESRQTAALSGSGLRPPAVIRRDSSSARAREAGEGQDQNGAGPPGVVFSIPASITAALGKAPTLGAVPMLARPDWWQRQVRAHPGVDFARELLRAEAWIAANPARAPRKDLAGFLWRWFSKAERDGAGA
jgi:hypothetical protein